MKQVTPPQQQGFSLIELMIAMVVLAIGIMATMAMELSALAGYNSARDITGATEMVKNVEQIIRAEARGWEGGEHGAGVTDVQAAYSGVGHENLFDEVIESSNGGGNWRVAFDDPVTARMNEPVEAMGPPGDDAPERFCVYIAGEEADGGDVLEEGVYQVGIAVVYPGANASWGDDDCNSINTNDLDTDSVTNTVNLETDGYRVVHASTVVRPMGGQF